MSLNGGREAWHEHCCIRIVSSVPLHRLLVAVGFFASLQAEAGVVAEIPLQYRDGFLWLKVNVSGQREPLNFILDSGAASSVLDINTARRLKAKFGWPVSIQGVHSQTTGRWIERFEARAAGIALPGRLIAFDLRAVGRTCYQPIDGLLGADFFRGRIVQIDYKARMVRILSDARQNVCGTMLPMVALNGTFSVPVNVDGNPRQWMRVDTGCDSAMEWVVNGSGQQRISGSSIGLTSAHSSSRSTDVQLGGRLLPNVKTGMHSQQIFPGESGLLGNPLLSRFLVTFDTPGNRLFLESK